MNYEQLKNKCTHKIYTACDDCYLFVKQNAYTCICSNACATYNNIDKIEFFILRKGDTLYSSEKNIDIMAVIKIEAKDGKNE